MIQVDGSTSLTEIANRFYLDNSSGAGPALKSSGADFIAGQYGSWTPIGAVQTASGYDVAWKVPGANLYTVWTTDSNGNYVSAIVNTVAGTNATLQALETTFGQDLNGDGIIGVPALTPTISSFSPDSAVVGDGITNANLLTLAGTAVANSTVKVYDGVTLLGSVTADGTGAWNFATGQLTDGIHSFSATDTNASDNTSTASAAFNVTVDTHTPAAPVVASFSPDTGTVGDGITSATALTLTGTAEANSTVNVYDGTTELGTTTANSSGAWNFATTQLASGNHAFTATDADAAGNTSAASPALNVTVAPSSATATPAAIAVGANNTVNIGAGNYTITGNALSDTFVFGPTIGQDVITNFKSTSWWTNDVLQFSSNTFSDFATVLNHAAQVGSDVVIGVDATDSVTLKNFQLANLHQNNIHIV